MTNCFSLSEHEHARAWRLMFTASLDELPDGEIAWEWQIWQRLWMPELSHICNDLLRERRASGFAFEGEATPDDLELLWQRIPQCAVLEMVRTEACSLVTAARTVYWLRAGTRSAA